MKTMIGQRYEYQADQYGAALMTTADMRTALIKLNRDNLEFPIADWLYSLCYRSHPPLMDRLDQLQ